MADRFHQPPMLFLDLPLSQVEMHMRYTVKLIDAQQRAREALQAEDDD